MSCEIPAESSATEQPDPLKPPEMEVVTPKPGWYEYIGQGDISDPNNWRRTYAGQSFPIWD